MSGTLEPWKPSLAAEFRAAPGVEDWSAGVDGASVEYRTRDFATGARLFAAITELAEAANHHPDVDIRYSSVRVRLFTHSAQRLDGEGCRAGAADLRGRSRTRRRSRRRARGIIS